MNATRKASAKLAKKDPTTQAQRALQNKRDAADARKAPARKASGKRPMQAGARKEPVNPLPEQHLAKPGLESQLDVQPRHDAPAYRGSGKLEGMSAIVTGGDSGIGRAVSVLFAREGANVAIIHLPSEQADADQTCAEVEKEGGRCLSIIGDVRDPAFCRRAVKRAADEFGQLDILINNAAFQLHANDIEDIDDEQWDMTMRTNLYGYFQMARAVVPLLREGSAIINTGSVTGLQGSAQLLDYSATKGAIHAFTKSLASNLLPRGIRVNAVAPGPVWTPLNPADRPADKTREFGSQVDMGRPAQPEEIAPAFVFLAAPACASYITGLVLPITGNVGAI